MRPTRLGLSENARAVSAEVLQKNLSEALNLRLAIKQAHWTVRGPRFQQLHELFDSFVAPLDAEIDEIAERLATLGGTPDGRAETVAGSNPYPLEATSDVDHLSALADRFAALGNTARAGIDGADAAGDADTADLLTGTSRFLDQSLWFLEAHLDES